MNKKKGEKYWKCFHGSRKTFTITRSMNVSQTGKLCNLLFLICSIVLIRTITTGLINHLKTHFLAMYKLFLDLKEHAKTGSHLTLGEL